MVILCIISDIKSYQKYFLYINSNCLDTLPFITQNHFEFYMDKIIDIMNKDDNIHKSEAMKP